MCGILSELCIEHSHSITLHSTVSTEMRLSIVFFRRYGIDIIYIEIILEACKRFYAEEIGIGLLHNHLIHTSLADRSLAVSVTHNDYIRSVA